MTKAKSSLSRDTLMIDLALQGGGSHGAFTWGVLDRLLEAPWFEIEGISGTSAGAMNAAVLAHGIATGGREGGPRRIVGILATRFARGGDKPVPAHTARQDDGALDAGQLSRLSGGGHDGATCLALRFRNDRLQSAA